MTDLHERLVTVAIRLRRYANTYRHLAKRLGASDDPMHLARAEAYTDAAAMIQRELDKDQEASGT